MMVDKSGGRRRAEGGSCEGDAEAEDGSSDVEVNQRTLKHTDSTTSSPGQRTKSNQRWMKLRTTVQLSGAIQKTKPPLKREDSFLKRFSTRQVPELQETVDTGDDGEGESGVGGESAGARARRKRRKRAAHHPCSVVNPDENFYYYWLLLLAVCVLYNLWTLIVRESFPELQAATPDFWFACDAFTDAVFLLDVGVQFRTGYLEQGLMVYDSKKLAGHYVRSRAFMLDLTALFPLDLLQFNLGSKPILRFPRFLKVYRVYDYYYIVESRTVYPNVWRVVNLIHILLILAHWFGCFYYLLSEAEGFQGDWVYPYRPGEYATLTRKYLGSLYWSTLTLTTIGDLPTPETNADKGTDGLHSLPRRGHKSRLLQFNSNRGYVFTIVSYLIGVFIFATIVGQVGNVITNRNANRLEFERLLDGAKTYMRHHKVPGGMKRRVLRWYDYSWSRGRIQGGGDINTALGLLPDKLKTELALHVNLSVLKKVTIFQECQPEFLHDLVLKMKAYIFTPGDLICRKGEVAREMFIIADGILEVISETGRVLTTMKAGDFFGEIGILNLDGLNKRTADVRSVGYSELFSLSREDVLTAMKDYPEAQEILQNLGRKRLMEARNMNRAWKISAQQQRESRLSSPPAMAESTDERPGKRIVEKIRSDVKELKNVLRKSKRTSRSKSDCLELEPLTKSREGGNKGMLCRMARVSNDDTSQEEENPKSPGESKVGAGLPLLHRLKLLKEKQESEKSEMKKSPLQSTMQTPVIEDSKEPEVVGQGLPLLQRLLLLKQKEERETGAIQSTAAMTAQVLATTVRTQHKSTPGNQVVRSKRKSIDDGQTQPHKTLSLKMFCKPIESEGTAGKENENREQKGSPKRSPPKESPSDIEPLIQKTEMSQNPDKQSWRILKKATVLTGSPKSPVKETVESEDQGKRKGTTEPIHEKRFERGGFSGLLSKIKASSSKEPDQKGIRTALENVPVAQETSNAQSSIGMEQVKVCSSNIGDAPKAGKKTFSSIAPHIKERTKSLRTNRKAKIYKSIDDLSPEYSGLPFVKRLKILNERQKLAELERDSFVRSSSLDSGGGGELGEDTGELTRSHSEAIAIEVVLRNQQQREKIPRPTTLETFPIPLPVSNGSPESNETVERRKLKSILKKLSSGSLIPDPPKTAGAGSDPVVDMKKLMRAQTVEGYAARHSKLTKSVTFNQVAVQSPPSSPTTPSSERALSLPPVASANFPVVNSVPASEPKNANIMTTVTNGQIDSPRRPDTNEEEPLQSASSLEHSPTLHERSKKTKNCVRSSSTLQPTHKCQGVEYFGDIFVGIKQIIQEHLDEIKDKYVSQVHDLELEVRKRDGIISQLQKRIQELEQKCSVNDVETSLSYDLSDHPFMRGESIETVLSSDNCLLDEQISTDRQISWDESDTEEGAVGPRLPTSTSSRPLLYPSDQGCTRVDMGSDTSSTDAEEEHSRYNKDWEFQLLVQEMEAKDNKCRRRAVSFDSAHESSRYDFHRPSSFEGHRRPRSFEGYRRPERRPQVLNARSLEDQPLTPYTRSLSIGSLHRTFSSTLRRSLGHLIKGSTSPSSPDIVPTISRHCSHPPPPPPRPPDT